MPQCNLQHENCNSAEISRNITIVWKTCVNNLSGQLAWSGVETLCNFFRVLHHLSFANGPQIVSMCSLPTQSNTKNLNHVRTLQFALKSKWPSFQIADIEFVIITKKKWCILIISQEFRWSKIIWGSCWGSEWIFKANFETDLLLIKYKSNFDEKFCVYSLLKSSFQNKYYACKSTIKPPSIQL